MVYLQPPSMTSSGERVVIMLIVLTGLAGIFAWSAGFVEAEIVGWMEWTVRGIFVALFLLLVLLVYRQLRRESAD